MGRKKKSTRKINASLIKAILLVLIIGGVALWFVLQKGIIKGYNVVLKDTQENLEAQVIEEAKKAATLSMSIDKKFLGYSTSKNATQETAQASVKLDDEVLPLDGSLQFASSNEEVVSVSPAGVITAKDIGVATISVTDKYNHVASEDIEVILPIQKLSLSNVGTNRVGKQLQLKLVTTPNGASVNTLSYSSSNEGIATVNRNGIVKGVTPGTVTITVTDEYTGISDSVKITVTR